MFAQLLSAAGPSALEIPSAGGGGVRPLAAPIAVLLFTRTDCPISNRYAPEVRRLYAEFSPKKIAFYLIYVDPRQSAEAVLAHKREFDYPMDALLDRHHQLVKLARASITPEAAVFVNGELAYHGRIDDRYVSFGTARREATVHDLHDVLQAVVDGKRPALRETRSVGCFIEDLK